MKVLELMCSLEEAYDRFGDIDITVRYIVTDFGTGNTAIGSCEPKELIIESDEFIIKCE